MSRKRASYRTWRPHADQIVSTRRDCRVNRGYAPGRASHRGVLHTPIRHRDRRAAAVEKLDEILDIAGSSAGRAASAIDLTDHDLATRNNARVGRERRDGRDGRFGTRDERNARE